MVSDPIGVTVRECETQPRPGAAATAACGASRASTTAAIAARAAGLDIARIRPIRSSIRGPSLRPRGIGRIRHSVYIGPTFGFTFDPLRTLPPHPAVPWPVGVAFGSLIVAA